MASTTIRAVFDGEVFRLEQPQPLRTAATYLITILGEAPIAGEATILGETPAEGETEEPYVLTKLGLMAVDMGIEDFAARHDWYAHGRLPDDES